MENCNIKNEEAQKAAAARQLEFIEKARVLVENISKNIGRPLFSHIETFGCQMNFDSLTTYA